MQSILDGVRSRKKLTAFRATREATVNLIS